MTELLGLSVFSELELSPIFGTYITSSSFNFADRLIDFWSA
ncbi:hypothetical protein [Lactococcus sp. NH2-7C]|nr:hypothetical protein [Lactococcus sp. NH2-7C]WGV31162.1 hypothetical protein QJV49_03975 [Lactococcus sp. NH2-7C]